MNRIQRSNFAPSEAVAAKLRMAARSLEEKQKTWFSKASVYILQGEAWKNEWGEVTIFPLKNLYS